ncbi:MAG: hypothetical protein KGR16_02630 [Verrucomicrobia bacterium]|nr:hypothetical protein [Verrucomicrobiota bacterium]MDE3047764.1 hypothetical protein [Verrucomicrobiota bacterium]
MLQTRAIYNLFRLNAAEGAAVQSEPWALEDLRGVDLEELFSRLRQKEVQLDRHSFCQFSDQCDTPEEMTDLLLPDEATDAERDPFYLIVFELWRRLIPEKRSLSIFCDELDHQISLYDLGDIHSDEPIQDALAYLLEILDENADSGADPEEILRAVSEYCAHDLESFVTDYISDLLDSGNSLYASELIEGFSPYVSDPFWFDFLRMRLISFTDIGDANLAMHRLLENELDVSLLLEIIRFLSANGEYELFKTALQKTIPQLTDPEEIVEVTHFLADFYHRLDEEDKEQKVHEVLAQGKEIQVSDLKALL